MLQTVCFFCYTYTLLYHYCVILLLVEVDFVTCCKIVIDVVAQLAKSKFVAIYGASLWHNLPIAEQKMYNWTKLPS